MEKPVILIIADISGYTRFVASNVVSIAHSQTVIRELVETIIKQVEIPLEVTKLEGDAVFLYSVKEDGDAMSWNEKKTKIGDKLLAFFDVFAKKVVELSKSTMCECNACMTIDKLRLKIVVHSGTCVFQRIGKFDELGGLDAIVVHRLLKNSLEADEYILMTETGYNDIKFPEALQVTAGTERYDDIGIVKTLVYYPRSSVPDHHAHLEHEYNATPFSDRYRTSARLGARMSLRSLALITGLKSPDHYRNLTVDYEPMARLLAALRLIVSLPFSFLAKSYKAFFKLRNNTVEN